MFPGVYYFYLLKGAFNERQCVETLSAEKILFPVFYAELSPERSDVRDRMDQYGRRGVAFYIMGTAVCAFRCFYFRRQDDCQCYRRYSDVDPGVYLWLYRRHIRCQQDLPKCVQKQGGLYDCQCCRMLFSAAARSGAGSGAGSPEKVCRSRAGVGGMWFLCAELF